MAFNGMKSILDFMKICQLVQIHTGNRYMAMVRPCLSFLIRVREVLYKSVFVAVFWFVTPCNDVIGYGRFGGP
jgi:hypothetical protein